MTDKEKIRQEIERLINDKTDGKHVAKADIIAPQRSAYLDILQFIDSLPEEPAREDLESQYTSNMRYQHAYTQDDLMKTNSEDLEEEIDKYLDLADLKTECIGITSAQDYFDDITNSMRKVGLICNKK